MQRLMTCGLAAVAIATPLNAQSPAGVPLHPDSASLARSQVAGSLPESTFWPEGVDDDARSGRYYLASVRH